VLLKIRGGPKILVPELISAGLERGELPSREPICFDRCSCGMRGDAGDALRPSLIEIFSKSFGLKVSNLFFQIRGDLFRNKGRMFRNMESFPQERMLFI
jgi:hypothetical protein